jgi:hypothetical protein
LAGNTKGTFFPTLEQRFDANNGSHGLEAFVRHSKSAAKDITKFLDCHDRTFDVHSMYNSHVGEDLFPDSLDLKVGPTLRKHIHEKC